MAAPSGRPPRRDVNEMSISMESSIRSSNALNAAHITQSNSSEDFVLSREASRDRNGGLSNNPFTSSGSFQFRSASWREALNNHTNMESNSVANTDYAVGPSSSQLTTAASRYRAVYDIGQVPVEEYYSDDFDEDDGIAERYEFTAPEKNPPNYRSNDRAYDTKDEKGTSQSSYNRYSHK